MRSLAIKVKFTDVDMVVELLDGRTITVPISWFPRLSHASQEALNHWELLGEGEGIHWPDIDEDIRVC
jgi:hypothetical protein